MLAFAPQMIETFAYDLKYAVRVLRRSPQNTLIAVAILGLAIGANTAMFSAINHVLLRPFPFADADRLVRVRDRVTASDGQRHAFNMPARHVLAVRERTPAFDGVVAFSGEDMTLAGADVPERVSVVLQSDNAADTLGVRPMAGRTFSRDEQRIGTAAGVIVIGDALARARFGSAAGAVGRTLRLDNRTFSIVGVMPPQYAFPYEAQVWMPLALDAADTTRDFAVFCRLKPGVSLAQAVDALRSAAAAIAQEPGNAAQQYDIELMTIRDNLVGTQDAPLRALTDIVIVLLLIACVNVATLLLARSVSRRREFALRAVLGAGRSRHVRQLLAESVVLAALGCCAGLLLASWIGPLTASLVPTVLSGQLGLVTPSTDARVLLFAIAASLISAIVAGVVPAFGSWRTEPRLALGDGGRTSSAGPASRRLLGGLIVAETALTLILLAGAGLVIRNFVRLETKPLGFDASGLLAVEVTLPAGAYPPGPLRSAIVARMLDQVRAAPGVVASGATTVNPLGGGTWTVPAITEEAAARDPRAAINVNERLVTPGLLEAMGVPLVRGRLVSTADRASTVPAVVVSRRLANRWWPGADAIGKRVRRARPNAPWLTVVGVAGDVDDAHDPGVPIDTWYLPFDQQAASAAAEHVYVMTRAHGDALGLVSAVEHAVVAADPTLAPYAPAAMDRYRSASLVRERVGATFMIGFGTFGLALAALGVYGVMAFGVSQRTAEIGIRLALGATTRDIIPLVLGRALALIGGGVAAGIGGALVLNRLLAGLLVEVGRVDAGVLGGAAALIMAAAAVASLLPAIAAARHNPLSALKTD